MKTFTSYLKVLLIATSIITFTSCSKDDSPSPQDDNNGGNTVINPEDVEGSYVGLWLSSGDQLIGTTAKDYQSMEISFTEENYYSWKFTPKPGSGQDGVFKGVIYQQMTDFKHTSGARIWQVNIQVSEFNGQPSAGGWTGIFTFENPNTLILNVEPNVTSWPKHPSAEDGVGSGDKGTASVYTFSRQ